MTDQAEAQAALDAVRESVGRVSTDPRDGTSAVAYTLKNILDVLRNLDARLKALEGK